MDNILTWHQGPDFMMDHQYGCASVSVEQLANTRLSYIPKLYEKCLIIGSK